MNKYLVILASLSAFLGAACAPPVDQVDTAAEKAAIEQTVADWLEGTLQGGEAGADAYASFVTADAVWLPPNAARVDGRDAVRDLMLGFTGAEDFTATWGATDIEIGAGGKLAYAIGTFEISLKDPEGNTVSDRGKWLTNFEKQADGSWRGTAGSWNSDLPAAVATE